MGRKNNSRDKSGEPANGSPNSETFLKRHLRSAKVVKFVKKGIVEDTTRPSEFDEDASLINKSDKDSAGRSTAGNKRSRKRKPEIDAVPCSKKMKSLKSRDKSGEPANGNPNSERSLKRRLRSAKAGKFVVDDTTLLSEFDEDASLINKSDEDASGRSISWNCRSRKRKPEIDAVPCSKKMKSLKSVMNDSTYTEAVRNLNDLKEPKEVPVSMDYYCSNAGISVEVKESISDDEMTLQELQKTCKNKRKKTNMLAPETVEDSSQHDEAAESPRKSPRKIIKVTDVELQDDIPLALWAMPCKKRKPKSANANPIERLQPEQSPAKEVDSGISCSRSSEQSGQQYVSDLNPKNYVCELSKAFETEEYEDKLNQEIPRLGASEQDLPLDQSDIFPSCHLPVSYSDGFENAYRNQETVAENHREKPCDVSLLNETESNQKNVAEDPGKEPCDASMLDESNVEKPTDPTAAVTANLNDTTACQDGSSNHMTACQDGSSAKEHEILNFEAAAEDLDEKPILGSLHVDIKLSDAANTEEISLFTINNLPKKLPSMRKSLSPTIQKQYLEVTDLRRPFANLPHAKADFVSSKLETESSPVPSMNMHIGQEHEHEGHQSTFPSSSRLSDLNNPIQSVIQQGHHRRSKPRSRAKRHTSLLRRTHASHIAHSLGTCDLEDSKLKNGSLSKRCSLKSILKDPCMCSNACECELCACVRDRSRKAMDFTKCQMQDTRYIVGSLLNEIKLMQELIQSIFDSDTSSRLNRSMIEAIRMSSSMTAEANERSNKWLAMMTLDCNRFCKIMGVPKRSKDSSKKLRFADEDGKQLCDIAYFASPPNSEDER